MRGARHACSCRRLSPFVLARQPAGARARHALLRPRRVRPRRRRGGPDRGVDGPARQGARPRSRRRAPRGRPRRLAGLRPQRRLLHGHADARHQQRSQSLPRRAGDAGSARPREPGTKSSAPSLATASTATGGDRGHRRGHRTLAGRRACLYPRSDGRRRSERRVAGRSRDAGGDRLADIPGRPLEQGRLRDGRPGAVGLGIDPRRPRPRGAPLRAHPRREAGTMGGRHAADYPRRPLGRTPRDAGHQRVLRSAPGDAPQRGTRIRPGSHDGAAERRPVGHGRLVEVPGRRRRRQPLPLLQTHGPMAASCGEATTPSTTTAAA